MSVVSLFLASSLYCSSIPAVDDAVWHKLSPLGGQKEARQQVLLTCNSLMKNYDRVSLKYITGNVASVEQSDVSNERQVHAGRTKIRWAIERGAICPCSVATAWFAISAFAKVWVAKKRIAKFSVLDSKMFSYEDRNVGAALGLKNIVSNDPTGLYVIKNIPQGRFVTSDYVSARPLIIPNSKVEVVMSRYGVQIKFSALAVTEGWHVDDEVVVRNESSKKLLRVKVKAQGVVYVDG